MASEEPSTKVGRFMKASIIKGFVMVRVLSYGPTETTTKATGTIISKMVMVSSSISSANSQSKATSSTAVSISKIKTSLSRTKQATK